ncbi:hypothetical protein D5086_021990 [Populus alba]|uniref:Uncharacterized protein n=1 Tax=Populus alba TaxID=43335 RepID=A0ACC4BEC7_POPAL
MLTATLLIALPLASLLKHVSDTDTHTLLSFPDRKAIYEAPGSACYDPRFIGGDGIVFYFHGNSNEHFSIVSDFDLQINSRFIGHRIEQMVNEVPVTIQDDKIHNYRVPANDCFVHLEVQFRFFHLSSKVGVLGRTWRPGFQNPAKPGVAMPILGGENNYRTTSLFSTDFNSCIFSPESGSNQQTSSVMNYGTLV